MEPIQQPSGQPDQQPTGKRKYIIGGGILLVLIVGVFLYFGGTNQLSGNFYDFANYSKNIPAIPPKQIPSARDNSPAGRFQIPEPTKPQKAIPDNDPHKLELIEQKKIKDKAAEDAKNKALNKLVISIDSTVPNPLVQNASTITAANPLTVATYNMCVQGKEDATIKSVSISSSGSSHNKTIQIFLDSKSVYKETKIASWWTGDFLTVENQVITAGTCQKLTLKMTGADPASTWQRFKFAGAKASLPVEYIDTYKNQSTYSDVLSQTLVVLSSESFVHVLNSGGKEDITYVFNQNDIPVSSFGFMTKVNSTANIKSITVKMQSPSAKTINVTPYFYTHDTGIDDNVPPWPKANGMTYVGNSNNLSGPVDLMNGQEIKIPINQKIPYSSVMDIQFAINTLLDTPTDLQMILTNVETDATPDYAELMPISGPMIHFVKDATFNAIAKINLDPQVPWTKWIDSTETKANIAKSTPVTLASINLQIESGTILNVDVKNVKVKFSGLFSDPLKILVKYVNSEQLYTVNKNDIITIPDFTMLQPYGAIAFQIADYPTDPSKIVSLKMSIESMDLSFSKDAPNGKDYKKGDKLPLSIYQTPASGIGSYIPNFKWPQSFAIITIGPTALFKVSTDYQPGVQYVAIKNLPAGQDSEFTMNQSCLKSQGNTNALEFDFTHAARETSPFQDIKLIIGNTEVFLKPKDWTKEAAKFILTNPIFNSNTSWLCPELHVINPVDPVENIWFNLSGISAQTPAGSKIPVYVDSKLIENNPIKGTNYTFE